MKGRNFFSRKEQAEFIQKVYRETPLPIQNFFAQENRLLAEALSDCRSILEIGCGFGRALEAVSETSNYTGIDIGWSYVAEAKSQQSRGNWICADARRLPFSANTFDAVFCIQNSLGNMEGFEDEVLNEMRRAVSSGGRMIVSVYSEDSFEQRKLWYDRLIDAGIFGKIWIDPSNPRIVRSDTGWSSRCFDRVELETTLRVKASSIEIKKIDSFLYFCVVSF